MAHMINEPTVVRTRTQHPDNAFLWLTYDASLNEIIGEHELTLSEAKALVRRHRKGGLIEKGERAVCYTMASCEDGRSERFWEDPVLREVCLRVGAFDDAC